MPRAIKTEQGNQPIVVAGITAALCLILIDSWFYDSFYIQTLNRMLSDIVTHVR